MYTFKNLLGNFESLFDDEKDFLINAVRKGLVYLEVYSILPSVWSNLGRDFFHGR